MGTYTQAQHKAKEAISVFPSGRPNCLTEKNRIEKSLETQGSLLSAFPVTCRVTFGKSLPLFRPQFHHLTNE